MRAIPPPLWAQIFLVITYVLSLAPGLGAHFSVNTRTAGWIVLALSLAILAWAMLQFRFAKTQLLPNSETNNSLVTGGLFGLTRNPMYLAMTLFCIGGALWMGRWTMLLAPVLMFGM